MAEKVGEIFYEVSLDTSKMIGQSRQVQAQVGKTAEGFTNLAAKLTAVASAVGLVVAATKALQMAKVADEIRMLGARVEVAAGGMKAGAEAMRELEAISTRTRSSVAANADVFSRLNQSMLQLGGTQKDTLQLTELLGKGIAASGAKGAEAESAMRQFGQAMGTGKLSGDELNSMMENSQYLMQKMAEGMGVPVGALKKLGADGKLTADVILESFGKMAAQIDEDFAKLPVTIESATQVAKDASDRLSKAFDDVSGTSTMMAGVMQGTGKAFNALTDFITGTTEASTELERNQSIETWSNRASTVLSYVADGADLVTRMFKQTGTAIGGVAAAMGAALSGEFAQAQSIVKMMGADLKAIGGAQYAGAAIRESLGKPGAASKGPAKFSKIKPPKEEDKKGKGGKDSADSIAAAARRLALSELQNDLREELAMIEAQQGQLDLRRSAGLMGETDYYAQKRALLVQANELESKSLTDQIARLEKEKAAGKGSLEIQQQIGALRSKLAVQNVTAQNKQTALDQTAAAALAKHRAELESLTLAHERYMLQIDKAAQRRVDVIGMSAKGAGRAQGEWGIEDKYNDQERELRDRKLTSGNSWTPEDQSAFDLRLQQLKTEKQKEIDVYRNTFSAIDALEADWRVGAGRAVQEYADRAANAAQQSQDAFANAFQGMEDAMVQFAMTGKLDFKSLANSIIADIIRMQIKAAAVSFLSGMGFSGGGAVGPAPAPGFASGGYTGAGSKYQPAGIVHAGEVVWSQDDVKRAGGVGEVEAMRKGYASGGVVTGSAGMYIGSVPKPASQGGVPVMNVTIVGAPSEPEIKQSPNANGGIDVEVIFRQIEGRLSEGIASGSSAQYRAMKGRFGLQDS